MLGRLCSFCLAFSIVCAAPSQGNASDRTTEARFDAGIRAEDQRGWIERMASAPNHVGSPHDRANAEFLLAQFRQWGWDARIETFDVLYPTPIFTRVELVAPTRIVLGGQEPTIAGDPKATGALPPYVVYGGDGDVTADLIYVNYGLPEDYAALARRGIDVRGKIVIARYGGGWRGLKPKLAQEQGAIGCIIYSDPADDGYARGAAYPDGGARPERGVQRGSVSDVTLYPGDPLTPGVASVPGATRLARADAQIIMKIPTLPISYGDARQLLSRLAGPVVPAAWRGALPITYRMGGAGGVKVRLAVKSAWTTKPVNNVIAVLKGSRHPDEWVIRGNHFDAWNFGAWDPLAGMAAMMSEAKALGALAKSGWRPGRTIVYTAWDGEEPSMLGSTEWAERHADELRAKAVLYINTDSNGRGLLIAGGTPSYQQLVTTVAADVIDPETGASVAARRRASVRAGAFDRTGYADDAARAAAERGEDMPLDALGAGSDFVAFTHHLGLPTLYFGFGGEFEGGTYHSIYDNYRQFTTFVDPGLRYGVAAAQLVGRAVLRVADAETPPQRFTDFSTVLTGYIADIKRLTGQRRAEDEQRERLIADGVFRLASDPSNPVGAPAAVPITPRIDFAQLERASDVLRIAAIAYDAAYAVRGAALDPQRRQVLNGQLRDIDQLLLDDRGLPGRPWYRNLIAAPGRFTGYVAKTLPGVREAIEERRFEDADTYIHLTAAAITAYAARLDQARATIGG
jgi:N-acetylated-alpha-linked acidic dipeptidase